MANLVNRIVENILKIGPKLSTVDLQFEFDGAAGTSNPAFKKLASTTELLMRSGGRTAFRRMEKLAEALSGNLTMAATDHNKVLLVNTGSARSITLPPVAADLEVTIMDSSGGSFTNPITVSPASGTIDGQSTSLIQSAYGSKTYFCDGSNWFTRIIKIVAPDIVETKSSVGVSFPTTTQYGDLGSIQLKPGRWEVSLFAYLDPNAANVLYWDIGLSTTSGNSSSGLVPGDNSAVQLFAGTIADSFNICLSVPSIILNPTSDTTYYMKVSSIYSVATPKYTGRVTARRLSMP